MAKHHLKKQCFWMLQRERLHEYAINAIYRVFIHPHLRGGYMT